MPSSSASSKDREARRPPPGTTNAQALEDWQEPLVDDDLPPPTYGQIYGTIEDEQGGLGTRASVTNDGRVSIRISEKSRGLQALLVPALESQLSYAAAHQEPEIPQLTSGTDGKPPPPMNVVIHVVGSRGDVQPFVALGKVLKEKYNHRVRLATHPVFKDFVNENGLEFFSIGGDPAELMAFMVKNPGLMPGFDTLRKGEIGRRRRDIGVMIQGCWRSCIEPGDGLGVASSDTIMRPFIADAIIANPPSFAHIHCAEKLGIPLHMMFTMPWSPTQVFPHPLANIQSSNTDATIANFLSYGLVDMMTWQGLGDIINRWRKTRLGLEPVQLTWAPGMLARLRVPFTYCWSPTLIPKPDDWRSHISISGFFFLPLGKTFTPASELAAFLDAGPPPVYIGFGSIVLDDPNAMTKLIFDAVKKSGQRALVSKGWGGFGADEIGIPEDVFMLGNVPHDWLFQRVSCVVHHGGAGTTAAGIACGKPTIVVPFFGDQPFWGAMVAKAGAGPDPIHHKQLTADNLAAAITMALQPTTVARAADMAKSISHETGTDSGAESFHRQMDVDKLRCTLSPSRHAAWRVKRTQIRLSPFAVAVLVQEKLLRMDDIKLYRPCEYETDAGPLEPISGATSALLGTMGDFMMGVADMPVDTLKAMRIYPDPSRAKGKAKAGAVTPNDGSKSPNRSQSATPARGRSPEPKETPEINATGELPTTPGSKLLEPTLSIGSSRGSSPSINSNSKAAPTKKAKDPYQVPTSINLDNALIGPGKGILRMVGAGVKSPMNFTLGLAKGFHNAPKLYGDDTVRKSEKVTGIASGLKVAGKEFGLGMYDGITGLVMQPIDGARKEGTAGFFKGFAKGIGGIVLKPGAAMFGLPAYTWQGFYKEVSNMFGPKVENYIGPAREAQGLADLNESAAEEREFIIEGWKQLQWYIKKNKVVGPDQKRGSYSQAGSRVASPAPTRSSRYQVDTKLIRSQTDNSDIWSPERKEADGRMPLDHITDYDDPGHNAQLEAVIQRSISETAKADTEKDVELERALRASMLDIGGATSSGYPREKAPLGQASHHAPPAYGQEIPSIVHHDEHDEDLTSIMRQSQEAEDKRKAEEEEHETVMRYMMKQSLMEEELRKQRSG